MKIHFKVTAGLLEAALRDLERPHVFAFERVGWISCRAGRLPSGGLVLLAAGYHPVADDDYLDKPGYGALMGSTAIRAALQLALTEPLSVFHVHSHGGRGRPSFSRTDEREMRRFVPDFFKVRPGMPHGALVLSNDSLRGAVWPAPKKGPYPLECTLIGAPLRRIGAADE
jgi:hypothetical protein